MWIDATVANFYLLHVWYDGLAECRMRYLDMYSAMAVDLSDAELDDIRKYHFIPPNDTCRMVPVGFVVHHWDHFFTIIFDYQRRTAHILGRNMSDGAMHVDGTNHGHWTAWGGPRRWRHVAALHGWGAGDPTDVSIRVQDWKQNGVDCGPTACSVLEQVLTSGLDRFGNLPQIHLRCGHQLRMKIFRSVSAQIPIRCRDYMMLLDGPEAQCTSYDMPDEDVISAIQRGQQPIECQGLLEQLIASSTTCEACRHPTLMPMISDRLHAVEDDHGISYNDTSQFEEQEVAEKRNLPQGTLDDTLLVLVMLYTFLKFFHSRAVIHRTDKSSAESWTES